MEASGTSGETQLNQAGGATAPAAESRTRNRAGDEEWLVADYLLRSRGISPVQAARLVLEILESTDALCIHGEDDVQRVRRVASLGRESLALQEKTVSFQELLESSLRHKSHRRERTIQEVGQYCRRILKQNPAWAEMPVRSISTGECQRIISDTFTTPVMQRKARVILHGLFAFALRRGWCATNPVSGIELPPLQEKPITALSISEVHRLLRASLQEKHRPCAPALGLLLWAGIRPYELERLHWENVHFSDRVITIPPTHSKTGGARQVNIYPVLYHWLRNTASFRLPQAPIIPASWARRWRALRKDAGFSSWDADILRHTFASYHLKYFRNLQELQIDMGHASTELLRTRYIGLDKVTKAGAKSFWTCTVASLAKSSAPDS